jgi:hypothetical protein
MYHSLKEGGLLIITAAGEGRPEHGTSNHHPNASPATNDYYQNITNRMFQEVLNPSMFHTYFLSQRPDTQDIQFYGIKGNFQLYPSPIPIMTRIENLIGSYSETIVEKKKEPDFHHLKSRLKVFWQSAINQYIKSIFKTNCPECNSTNYKDMGIDMWCKSCGHIGNL